MTARVLRTSYRNAQQNFAELYAKVAVEKRTVLLHNGQGEEVIWMSVSEFLEQNRRGATCEEILAELLA